MTKNLRKLAAQLSERDLETLLKLKKDGGKLAVLCKKRDQIALALAKIDREIAAVSGGSAPAKRGRKPGRPPAGKKLGAPKAAKKPGRPAGKKSAAVAKASAAKRGRRPKGRAGSLPAMLKAAMAAHKKPMSLGDAAKALTAAGYKSKGGPAMLRKMVMMACLRRSDLFKRASKGMYTLK